MLSICSEMSIFGMYWYSISEDSPQGVWDTVAERMLLEFAESDCPIFRAVSTLSRGRLKSKGHGKLTIHFAADLEKIETIPLKPSSASKSGKIFRGAGRDPIFARGERSMTGPTDEGQSRRIVWEVCPVKRLLLSVAKITKAGNQVYLGEDKAFVKNNKTGQITNLRR